MKTLLALHLLLVAGAPAAGAATCSLGNPIPLEQPLVINSHLLSKSLQDVVFWSPPSLGGDYDPDQDALEIDAFHVHANAPSGDIDLSVWGARVNVLGKPLSLGFQRVYTPSMGGFMRLKVEEGKSIYAANDGMGKQAADLVTFVRDNKLVALAIAAPRPGGGRQVLCLRSAKLKP
jgi:hypothetical protein